MRCASDTHHGASSLRYLLRGPIAAYFSPGHFLHEDLLTICKGLPIPRNPENDNIAVLVLPPTHTVLAGDLEMCRMISNRKLGYPVIVGSETDFPNGTTDQIAFENLTEAQQRMLYVQRNLLRKNHEQDVQKMIDTFASVLNTIASILMKNGGKRSDWTLNPAYKRILEKYQTLMCVLDTFMCVLYNDKIPQMPQQPKFSHEVATLEVTNFMMFAKTLRELRHNPWSFPIQVTYAETQFPFNAPCVKKLNKRQREMHDQEDIWKDKWKRECKRPRATEETVQVPTIM
jgi:hypothetical protein